LEVIHDDLVDGAELYYEEAVGIPEDVLEQWVKPAKELSVFATRQDKSTGPNYMPETIAKVLEEGMSREILPGDGDS
jgi:hypothetical protein